MSKKLISLVFLVVLAVGAVVSVRWVATKL
jgi:hypothetical protein